MCVSVCVYAIADRRAGKMLPLLMEIKDSILIHTDTHTQSLIEDDVMTELGQASSDAQLGICGMVAAYRNIKGGHINADKLDAGQARNTATEVSQLA